MTIKPSRFTLLELLIIVSIIGILASLLMPGLMNARYEARRVVCLSNLRQYSSGVMLHCSDHDRKYPNYAASSRPHPSNIYKGVLYTGDLPHRPKKQFTVVYDYLGFDGKSKHGAAARESTTCPFVLEGEIEFAGHWNVDTDGDGIKERQPRFPYYGRFWSTTSHAHYYATYRSSIFKRPMVYQGDTFELKSRYLQGEEYDVGSNILLSDMSVAGRGGVNYLSSHPPRAGQRAVLTPSGKNFWKHHTSRGFKMTNHYSANFILTDGSGKMEKSLNISNTIQGAHIITIPKKFYK
jgi:hypothetical protein